MCGLGIALLIPMVYDLISNSGGCLRFFLPSVVICVFIGINIILSCRGESITSLSKSDTFFIVVCFWVVVSLFSAFPFYFYDGYPIDFISSLFEATSGITTTGASVYDDVERLPNAIVLWRFILHFIGGVGIVAIGIIALPTMRIGGMQLFSLENSDKSAKLLPRSSQIASFFLIVYVFFIGIFAALLNLAGMNGFDSICHSISAIATGGFSTKNNGIIFYESRTIELIIIFAMFIGGITFLEIVRLIKYGYKNFQINQQIKLYLKLTLFVPIVIIVCSFIGNEESISWNTAIDYFFEFISSFTTTGLTLSEDMVFSPFFKIICIIISMFGACSGSTSGGIKLFRLQILLAIVKNNIVRLIKPMNISIHKYQGQKIDDNIIISVVSFFCLLIITFVLSVFFICLFSNLNCEESLSIVCSSLFNTGISLKFFITDSKISFSDMNYITQSILILDMIIGRLEVIPIFIVISKTFWK